MQDISPAFKKYLGLVKQHRALCKESRRLDKEKRELIKEIYRIQLEEARACDEMSLEEFNTAVEIAEKFNRNHIG